MMKSDYCSSSFLFYVSTPYLWYVNAGQGGGAGQAAQLPAAQPWQYGRPGQAAQFPAAQAWQYGGAGQGTGAGCVPQAAAATARLMEAAGAGEGVRGQLARRCWVRKSWAAAAAGAAEAGGRGAGRGGARAPTVRILVIFRTDDQRQLGSTRRPWPRPRNTAFRKP